MDRNRCGFLWGAKKKADIDNITNVDYSNIQTNKNNNLNHNYIDNFIDVLSYLNNYKNQNFE